MRKDVYREFSFDEDIEIMNLDYRMKNMQDIQTSENCESDFKNNKENIFKKIFKL